MSYLFRPKNVAILCIAVNALWFIFGYLFCNWLIEQAYLEQSLPFINQIISGRDEHPLDKYLSEWKIAYLIGQGVLLFLSSILLFDACLASRSRGKATGDTPPLPINVSSWERWKAYILMLVIVVPTLFCIFTRSEWWPYSNFPMFSRANDATVCRKYILLAVGEQGEEIIQPDSSFLPMGPPRLARMANHLAQSEEGKEKLNSIMSLVAKKFVTHVEANHQAGDYRKLKLVTYEWKLQPRASNYPDPDLITILAEIDLVDPQAK